MAGSKNMGVGIAHGVANRVAIGAATHNIAVWTAIGAGMGVALGSLFVRGSAAK